jgi:hypothetical protein
VNQARIAALFAGWTKTSMQVFVHYCSQSPSQLLAHKLYSRAQLSRQAPVVQALSQLASPFAQLWQQVGSNVAEADAGFASTIAAKTKAKRINIRSNGRT